jgi:F420-dependent oxidoreductase-like protein
VRFSFWPRPHTPWPDVLELCAQCESSGWDGLWYADHFMPDGPDPSDPINECWTTVSALAARIPRVRLGTLVLGNTYRHPAIVAKMAAGVDRISGGRFVLGLGAAWQENEHRAYGIPFGSIGERLRRLDEACHVIRSLLTRDRTDFDGEAYRLRDAPLEPKPVQARLPLLIGGGGERVTLRIAARHADEWNVWGTPELLRHKMQVLDRHAEALGRDPARIARSAVTLIAPFGEPETARRLREATDRPLLAGTPDEMTEVVRAYAEAGVDELVIPDFVLGDGARRSDTLERFIREVAPAFR